MACQFIDHPNISPGWGCCKCRTYNSILRKECKICKHVRCDWPKDENDAIIKAMEHQMLAGIRLK